jgi:mannosyltransferase OCH1-like enzyme
MIYLSPTYDSILKKSYAYDQVRQDRDPEWKLVAELYQKNYIYKAFLSSPLIGKIPKIIHQIWLGSDLPFNYRKLCRSWETHHPGWKYKLWTDADASKIKITRRDLYDQATNPGMKSDILRYEILRQYGGVYVDTDFVCIKPLDDLTFLDFFTGIGYDGVLQLYIGLIATVPNHPIINACCNFQTPNYSGNKASTIMNVTGANHFTKAFLDNVTKDTKEVVAFPTDFFYPFPNNVRGEKATADKYITECTYAIHLWETSWLINKRNGRSV